MEIGKALYTERLNLNLTQKQMCSGILSRPYYARVENGRSSISAENLFRILADRNINFEEFYELSQDDYLSDEIDLQNRMAYAVNTKNIDLLELYCKKILSTTDDDILKIRAVVTLAYFKEDLDSINNETKQKLKNIFNKDDNWIQNAKLLRLLANTMPLWPQKKLDFFIGRVLKAINKKKMSEFMTERYLILLGNYLVTCFDRKITCDLLDDILRYVITVTSSFHLMIYRIFALYMEALLRNNKEKVLEIQKKLKLLGYEKVIASWPQKV